MNAGLKNQTHVIYIYIHTSKLKRFSGATNFLEALWIKILPDLNHAQLVAGSQNERLVASGVQRCNTSRCATVKSVTLLASPGGLSKHENRDL